MANPNTAPLSEHAVAEANQAPSIARSSGAAIVARVSMDGDYCGRGRIQLHQKVNGYIVTDSEVDIGQTLPDDFFTIEKAKNIFDFDAYVKVFSPENIKKSLSVDYMSYGSDIRTSFRAIKPGEYYITSVYCQISDKRIVFGSKAFGFIFPGPTRPVLGDNFISIKAGQIVDAGVVNIVTVDKGFFSRPTAFLSGLETPQSFRNILKNTLSGLESKLTYARFSATPAR